MTDTTPKAAITFDFAAWEAHERERARLAAEVRPGNKTAIFDALARANISIVTVGFDGCGDSGQIESIDAFAGDAPAELPSEQIELARVGWWQARTILIHLEGRRREARLRLPRRETHGGWENNEGAYGEFTFDVASRTITLAYNEQHMESEHSEHVF